MMIPDQYKDMDRRVGEFFDDNQENIQSLVQGFTEIATNIITEVQVHYYLNNFYVYETESGDIFSPTYTDQILTLKLLCKRSLDEGDEIHLTLPVSDVGRFTSSGRADPSTYTDGAINLEKYYLDSDLPVNKSLSKVELATSKIIVSISSHVEPNTQLTVTISGKNILEKRGSMTYGIAVGNLVSKMDMKNWKLPNMDGILDNMIDAYK